MTARDTRQAHKLGVVFDRIRTLLPQHRMRQDPGLSPIRPGTAVDMWNLPPSTGNLCSLPATSTGSSTLATRPGLQYLLRGRSRLTWPVQPLLLNRATAGT